MRQAVSLPKPSSADLFKSRMNPFSETAAVDCPFLSSSFRDALAALYYGLEYGSSILLLIADPGSGKTTLLRHFERRAQRRERIFFFSSDHLDAPEILRTVTAAIAGVAANNDDLHALRMKADELLAGKVESDNPVILLLDYDHNPDSPAAKALCDLAGLESFRKGLLRIIIAGSSLLAEELQRSELRDSILRVPLFALTASEVAPYIDNYLRRAGWSGTPLFTAEACGLIAQRTSGNPSAINKICFDVLDKLSTKRSVIAPDSESTTGLPLDASYIERIISGPGSSVEPDSSAPGIGQHRRFLSLRAATVACLLLILISVFAGLWYRIATKTHTPKHSSASLTTPYIKGADRILPHQVLSKPATERSHGKNTISGARKSLVVNSTPQPAPPTVVDGNRVVQAALRGDLAIPPARPGMTSGVGTPSVNIANHVAHASSLPAVSAGLKNTENHKVQAALNDRKVISTSLSRRIAARRTSTSSPVRSVTFKSNRARTGTPSTALDVETDNIMDRGGEEMAEYQIRLGDAYMNMGEYDQALDSFSKALSVAPNNREAQEKVRRATSAKAAEESVLQ